MGNYYNEIDPFAAHWLRNLIDAGHIPSGDVDTRSIVDVKAEDLKGYTQCHFFAGIGGWSYALQLASWPDTRPVWTGSCPCQPFSAAGKQLGTTDDRHLWPAWFNLIRECGPSVIFGEQVEAAINHGWLDLVQSDLEGEGYAFGAAGIPAAAVGSLHNRPRLWFVADSERHEQPREEPCVGPSRRMGRERQPIPWDRTWESALCSFRAMANGIQRSVGGADAARNAIVPQVAEAFIGAYLES